jgi:DNA-binding transcriptional MocR family regulator
LLSARFPEWTYRKPSDGLQFFVELKSDEDLQRVLTACRRANLAIDASSVYTLPEIASRPFIVLGFGAMPFSQIKLALADLRRAL